MSTLPLLYSARSLQKRPSKQGGIFALNATNRSSTARSSSVTTSLCKMQSAETSELVKNNISQYYLNNNMLGSGSKKKSISTSIPRYAKSNFFDNQIPDTIMVVPDTLRGREGSEVESVGAINRNISTGIALANAVLINDKTQMKDIKKQLDQLNTKITLILEETSKQYKQKFSQLYKNLSASRRETLMQLKTNNGQVSKLMEDSSNTQLIASGLEQKTTKLRKQCNI